MVPGPENFTRPDFEGMCQFWTGLLAERGLPQAVRWLFYEDKARMSPTAIRRYMHFAFRPRPIAEADTIARFAYSHLDPKFPLAIVAYAIHGDTVITGFQGDLFTSDEDVYRDDWNIYFDAKKIRNDLECEIVSDDDPTWARRCAEQPHFLSELDYLVSVDALRRQFGYRG
jgi:hypothetical protein